MIADYIENQIFDKRGICSLSLTHVSHYILSATKNSWYSLDQYWKDERLR